MSELESVTKTLLQVVSSLQGLIGKRGTDQKAPEIDLPKLKKTPEMTYNQFIKRALMNRSMIEISAKKSSFRLQEDLQLLSDISQYSQISIKTFEEISKRKRIDRPTQILRNRFHQSLYKIEEKEMKKIVNWIEKQGVEGYLVWEDDEMKIQLDDPKANQKKRQRAIQLQSQAKRHQRVAKKSKVLPPICKQLNDVLKFYSKMVGIPIRTLNEKLDQLSGDFSKLNIYVQTKDARMLWTPEEDEILRRGGWEMEILKKYKGKDVEVRKKYLGI